MIRRWVCQQKPSVRSFCQGSPEILPVWGKHHMKSWLDSADIPHVSVKLKISCSLPQQIMLWSNMSCNNFDVVGDPGWPCNVSDGAALGIFSMNWSVTSSCDIKTKILQAAWEFAQELADGTTSGSSIFMQYTLDAGPVQGGDDSLQTAGRPNVRGNVTDKKLW
jgi:hypothetical protein